MRTTLIKIALLGALLCPSLLRAQVRFDVAGREVQVHGFLSEGFALTDQNNYLRMKTSEGSFFTELGANITWQLTDDLRVGAQAYQRNIGELGEGKVYLDWANIDYRFKDWLGVRAGKIKTTFALHNETQDQEFLHTWALLPPSVYSADLRSVLVAHTGADIYGNVDLKRVGSVAYTVYAGNLDHDPRGGFVFAVEGQGLRMTSDVDAKLRGIDVRWNTPVPGLMLGATVATGSGGFNVVRPPSPQPLEYSTPNSNQKAAFGEFTIGNFHATAEYRDQKRRAEIIAQTPARPVIARPGSDEWGWFVAGAYRFTDWLEAGSYYSNYNVRMRTPVATVTGPGRDHIYDKVFTVRFDPTRFWDIKVEGHFMDGVGSPALSRGFYTQDNPGGLAVKTNMLVIRTGLYF